MRTDIVWLAHRANSVRPTTHGLPLCVRAILSPLLLPAAWHKCATFHRLFILDQPSKNGRFRPMKIGAAADEVQGTYRVSLWEMQYV